jgi:predicted nucleotidyltransferase
MGRAQALRLFWKCNPAFVEWVQSPISYIEADGFRREALDLLPAVYVAERGSTNSSAARCLPNRGKERPFRLDPT